MLGLGILLISIKLRSSRPEVFLGKGVVKICLKFTGEHPCRCVISIKLLCYFRHGCSPVKLLHIFRTPFTRNTSGGLLLYLFDGNNFLKRTLLVIQSRQTKIMKKPLVATIQTLEKKTIDIE